jgi:peptidoglycan/xylan/chitin deacetylase (PgdA/CDA1 family)/uncharacterized caspase-like protein
MLVILLFSFLAVAAEPTLAVADVEPRVDAIVALHRKGIVALTSTDADKRDALDTAGRLAFDERTREVAELDAALTDEIAASSAHDFKPPPKRLDRFLTVVEERADLHDGDKLAFQGTFAHLVDALAGTPGDGVRREALRERLVADRDAVDGIAERYRVEARALLDRSRGMVVTREQWDAYVAFVRTIYSDDRVLADYADDLSVITEGSRGGKRRTDGALEIYGWDLPDHTFALTFDDGPSAEFTPQILAILDRYGVKAVFFEVGHNIAGNEELVKTVLGDGDLIGNHTLDHKNLPKQTDDEITRQIDESDTLIEAAAGVPITLFRPPYGARDPRVLSAVETRGERAFIWNVDSRDWADPVPESIATSVLAQVDTVKRGVILFHDVHAQTVEALPMVLDGLKERGITLALWDGSQVIGAPVDAPAAVVADAPSTPSAAPVAPVTPATTSAVTTGPNPSVAYHDSWAVVIGIDAYQHWPKLAYAQADAKGIRDALVDNFGFPADHVVSLFDGDATRARILQVLGDELPAKVGNNDRVFVFYSGHGATRNLPAEGAQRGYIIPVDAGTEHLQSEAISMSELHDIQEGLASKHVFFVMDACYGGLALTRGGSATGGDPARYLAEITRRPARQILTAGGADEEVADYGPGNHSIFTWTLLQGLDGQADLNGDGVITASELGSFVAPRVSALSRQTPAFGNLVGSGGGEFVFELAAGSELLSQVTQPADADAAGRAALEKQLAELQAKLATFEATRGGDPKVEAARYHTIGLEFFKKGDYPRARDAFAHAVDLAPDDVQAVNNLGYTDFQLKRYADAVAEIQRAITLDPDRAVAYLNLGDSLAASGDRAGAADAWGKYLQRVPDSPEAARLRAAMAAP